MNSNSRPASVDAYLAALEEPKRSTLQAVRAGIRPILPGAEECISYNMPAYRVNGTVVAGFAAFTNHLAYLPHSGQVLKQMDADLAGYTRTPGSLHFAVDTPLPEPLLAKLIALRLASIS
jgi:uncharacterized protein YdhG (YjbR/CyaY superfamily)